MNRYVVFTVIAIAGLLLGACASKQESRATMQYPPTDQVTPIFKVSQASPSCRVFSHLFATIPPMMKMSEFASEITAEAKSKGADMMLLGQSRQCTTESSLAYTYYGPDREYKLGEWPGWSFGFDEWGEQGDWASIGYNEWQNSKTYYDYPIIMQVVFLRCQN